MTRATLIVSGMLSATPDQGGATWAVLQYLLGLAELGHDVHLVEPVDAPQVATSSAATRCDAIMADAGLPDRWCVVGSDGSTAGLTRDELQRLARRTDVLLNVSGMLRDPDVMAAVPTRVYLDLDPAFVQLWHAAEGIDMRLDGHTHFVTVSDAVGRTIPDCGRTWLTTLPPVVLREWPYSCAPTSGALTTVANWRGYGSIEHEGVHYGQKAHSWRELLDVPTRVERPCEVALQIHPDERADVAALEAHRWRLLDPVEAAGTPAAYRHLVQTSWAELGIAKRGYVVSDSGWFSDRSACYLASGRPVIAQDTGFGRRLPTGEGLLAFADAEQAAEAVRVVTTDYERHRRRARAIAEEHLDSRRVLGRLLDRVLA